MTRGEAPGEAAPPNLFDIGPTIARLNLAGLRLVNLGQSELNPLLWRAQGMDSGPTGPRFWQLAYAYSPVEALEGLEEKWKSEAPGWPRAVPAASAAKPSLIATGTPEDLGL